MTNIWFRERTKVIDIISNVRKNEVVLGRAHQPPQIRPMDLASHHLETTTYDQGNQPNNGYWVGDPSFPGNTSRTRANGGEFSVRQVLLSV